MGNYINYDNLNEPLALEQLADPFQTPDLHSRIFETSRPFPAHATFAVPNSGTKFPTCLLYSTFIEPLEGSIGHTVKRIKFTARFPLQNMLCITRTT